MFIYIGQTYIAVKGAGCFMGPGLAGQTNGDHFPFSWSFPGLQAAK